MGGDTGRGRYRAQDKVRLKADKRRKSMKKEDAGVLDEK